jgi:hypothetical protein
MQSPVPWLEWSRKLQAIAQNGLLYSENAFDRERYEAVRDVAAQMMMAGSDAPLEVITGLFDAQTGYATPKVDTRGVVFRDGHILLVREAQDGRANRSRVRLSRKPVLSRRLGKSSRSMTAPGMAMCRPIPSTCTSF